MLFKLDAITLHDSYSPRLFSTFAPFCPKHTFRRLLEDHLTTKDSTMRSSLLPVWAYSMISSEDEGKDEGKDESSLKEEYDCPIPRTSRQSQTQHRLFIAMLCLLLLAVGFSLGIVCTVQYTDTEWAAVFKISSLTTDEEAPNFVPECESKRQLLDKISNSANILLTKAQVPISRQVISHNPEFLTPPLPNSSLDTWRAAVPSSIFILIPDPEKYGLSGGMPTRSGTNAYGLTWTHEYHCLVS